MKTFFAIIVAFGLFAASTPVEARSCIESPIHVNMKNVSVRQVKVVEILPRSNKILLTF